MSSSDFLSASDPGGFTVSCAHSSSLPLLKAWLAAQRFGHRSLDARDVRDESSLICALGNALKAKDLPPGSEWGSWDGAADYAWQSLIGQRRSHFAILILHADALLGDRFPLLLQAVELLIDVGNSTEEHPPHRVRLRVVLLGDGPQFPVLDAAANNLA
jgi:hypothetical protein